MLSCAVQSYGESRSQGLTVALALPLGPARLASWACLGLSTAFQGLSTAFPGPQYCLSWPPGRQLDANWTPSERQVGLPKRLPVPTYVFRTPKQLPSSTERLASSAYVAV